ncbi:hypothetical protein [Phytohabitans aurantiacus]|uniref:Uncharacterized protein n=1 Tax=Phytohabitans aurantiacus TaxID=3016789 RepID=A0ABQ5R8L5_9ACTN|nr:hypothetical protein [Phytohabitans aurantiacus]GLI02936.1 hypothetical protein Pa4123_82140 [Phytohabitans aurantiacus]
MFNTQPWRWRIGPRGLELRADRVRQLTVTDPDGRLLILSCGAALRHARIALAAAGYRTDVARLPEPADPDLLARIEITGRQPIAPNDVVLNEAIPRRRTDRRAFGDIPVSIRTLDRLRAAVKAQGYFLHVVRPDQMPMLAIETGQAADAQVADPACREELARLDAPVARCRRRRTCLDGGAAGAPPGGGAGLRTRRGAGIGGRARPGPRRGVHDAAPAGVGRALGIRFGSGGTSPIDRRQSAAPRTIR